LTTADVLFGQKRYAEAEVAYRRALADSPNDPRLYFQLGISLYELGRFDEAEAAQRTALALEPTAAEAHYELGNALYGLKRYEEAQAACERALQLDPKFAEARTGLARALYQFERFEEAAAHCRRALALKPTYWMAHAMLGNSLVHLGRFKEGETALRRAIALAPPDHAGAAKFDLANLLLSRGDFAGGWPLYEARFDVREPGRPAESTPPIDAPKWAGEALSGKRLLIWPEQGLGDGIQFVRYVPVLKSMGADITIACWRPLKNLFTCLSGCASIVAHEDLAERDFDFWTHLVSVAAQMRTDFGSIPAALPYLSASGELRATWRRRLPREALRVGLAWKGRPGYLTYRHLESIRQLRPLWDVPGVAFVSLQKESDEHVELSSDLPLVQLGAQISDLADTAAIIAELDLVITIDSAVAHLTGALAKPVWVMLSLRGDWRWLRERTDSPWYPGVMRLFRQPRHGDWPSVIAQVASALRAAAKT